MIIPELLDMILDFLHDSPADLRRCCLVNSDWFPAARFHLFAYLGIESVDAANRLAHMHRQAPHLLGRVNHLAFAVRPPAVASGVYNTLARLRPSFSCLERLSVFTLPSDEGLPALRDLIALPSLTHVMVLPTKDVRLMFSLFARRKASLRTLEVRSRFYGHQPDLDDEAEALSSVPKVPVRRLVVENIPPRMDFGPFDLTDLKHLSVADFHECDSFHGMLEIIGGELTSLDIAIFFTGRPESETFGRVALNLPRLTDLTLHIDNPSMLSGLPRFLPPLLSDGPVKQLTICTSRDCAPTKADLEQFEHRTVWDRIDEAIHEKPAVRFKLSVKLMIGGRLSTEDSVSELRACLPRLETAGRFSLGVLRQ
ncbi:hypothetical protein MKEN_00945600 [Mycena kentingensis (nom. inval.)]|nr:hypothetical protein MKEN_00945600 [Mycena kentingensis (nom. inval.)]